jgi:catechol 2,3-dioxygenase-like lactoylglutathione lyase family enzyme
MRTARIHHVTVVSPDAAAARQTFQDLFALAPSAGGPPALAIGDARIEFVTPAAGTRLGAALAAGGEGMAEICLEVASLDAAAETLRRAGVSFAEANDEGRRVLHVEPTSAHGVRLALIATA